MSHLVILSFVPGSRKNMDCENVKEEKHNGRTFYKE